MHRGGVPDVVDDLRQPPLLAAQGVQLQPVGPAGRGRDARRGPRVRASSAACSASASRPSNSAVIARVVATFQSWAGWRISAPSRAFSSRAAAAAAISPGLEQRPLPVVVAVVGPLDVAGAAGDLDQLCSRSPAGPRGPRGPSSRSAGRRARRRASRVAEPARDPRRLLTRARRSAARVPQRAGEPGEQPHAQAAVGLGSAASAASSSGTSCWSPPRAAPANGRRSPSAARASCSAVPAAAAAGGREEARLAAAVAGAGLRVAELEQQLRSASRGPRPGLERRCWYGAPPPRRRAGPAARRRRAGRARAARRSRPAAREVVRELGERGSGRRRQAPRAPRPRGGAAPRAGS